MQQMRHQKGFTLLEAIVALVIFASVGSALYAWIGTTLNGLNRIEAARQADEATQAALAMLETVNPMLEPEGTRTAGHYSISWTSEALAPPVDGLSPGGGLSLYKVGLWRLQVTVDGGGEPIRFATRRTGWQQVREPALPF